MTNHLQRLFFWGLLVLGLIGICFPGCSQQESASETDQKTSMQDVQKEAGDAARAVKEYAGQQKGRFMEEARTALDKMDQRIAEFQQEIDKKWGEMDQEARRKTEKAMETMKEKREVLSKKLKELKDSSAEAWEQLKKDFWESYESLKDSMESTEEEVTYI